MLRGNLNTHIAKSQVLMRNERTNANTFKLPYNHMSLTHILASGSVISSLNLACQRDTSCPTPSLARLTSIETDWRHLLSPLECLRNEANQAGPSAGESRTHTRNISFSVGSFGDWRYQGNRSSHGNRPCGGRRRCSHRWTEPGHRS